jgi:hypothetical protein
LMEVNIFDCRRTWMVFIKWIGASWQGYWYTFFML